MAVVRRALSHLTVPSKALTNRVRRLRGQIEALEGALNAGNECSAVLTQIAAIRGAAHGLMLEVLGEHLKSHISDEKNPTVRQAVLDEVLTLMRTHLR